MAELWQNISKLDSWFSSTMIITDGYTIYSIYMFLCLSVDKGLFSMLWRIVTTYA